jgi:tetratricopeptide (TPR) repeat protein
MRDVNTAAPAVPAASRKKNQSRFWPPALVALAGVAAYANSLSGPFVLDDIESIVSNPTIRHLSPIWSALWGPVRTGTGGRPVLNLSYAVNYFLGRLNVWGYHAGNLAIHVLAGLALYGIARRTLPRLLGGSPANPSPAVGRDAPESAPHSTTLLALSLAIIWTVHPLQTEAVTYVSQRAESLMGLFYLLTLYYFIRYAEDGRMGKAVCSVVFCALGMATKEVMVTAPVVVLLYDRTFVSGTFPDAWRRRWRYYLALASPWILLGYLLKDVGERGVGIDLKGPWWEYPLMESRVVLRYLGLAVWPHPLVLDYGRDVIRQTWAVAPYVAAILLILAAAAWAITRPLGRRPTARALGFAGAWTFLIMAPTSSFIAVAGQPMAEHRMYLPLAAVVAAAVLGLHSLLGRRSLPVLAALAVACGCLTYQRNRAFSSEEGIWKDTVAKCPQNYRAHAYLGYALAKIPGRLDEEVSQYQEALRLKPDFAEAHNNLGNTLEKIPGRQDDAIAQYEEALRLKPDMAEAHRNLGYVLAKIPGRLDEAIAHAREALRIRPDFAEAHVTLGIALESAGRVAEAVAEYEEALRLKPDDPEAHDYLGSALAKIPGRLNDAIPHFEEAVRLFPKSAEMRNNLGNVLKKIPGRLDEAIAQYEEALRLKPDSSEIHNNLGNALEDVPGRLNDAIAQFGEALRLKPDLAEAHRNMADSLDKIPGRLNEEIAQYEEALRLKPDDPEAHNNLGNALARRPARLDEAIVQYGEALRLKPDFAEAHNNRGHALMAVPGRLNEAVAEYEEALRLKPDIAQIHLNLAIALLELPGQTHEAALHLKAALRLEPGNSQAHEILSRIEAREP